jgi:murein DD-endopeptidase MepM/ murein hydrolase activator NlpD
MGDANVKPAGGTAGRRQHPPRRRAAALFVLALSPLLPLSAQDLPPLPGAPHVLSIARAPDSSLWVGTYGEGIFVLDRGAGEWRRIVNDTTGTSISWGFVHAFAFEPSGRVWYGTLGNGWGKSDDHGRTWTNWTFRQLGPEYQYVAPNGIVLRGDTVYVATADGVKVSWDAGTFWQVITDSMGVRSAKDPVLGRIGNQYVLAIAAGADGALWLSHLQGVERSTDGGRTWRATPVSGTRVRALLPTGAGTALAGTEEGLRMLQTDGGRLTVGAGLAVPTAVQQLASSPSGAIAVATDRGMFLLHGDAVQEPRDRFPHPHLRFVSAALPLDGGRWLVGGTTGLRVAASDRAAVAIAVPAPPADAPREPLHTWFARPVTLQPYIDQTYRYGSTMGGNFQQHQGVEFNGGEGTPVHAIGDGEVVFAGAGEAGANTVAIRHDRRLAVNDTSYHVFSAHYHHTAIAVTQGQRVRAGDLIGWVGNTGRATNDHLHLEVHAMPVDSALLVVDPAVRYPPYSTNPELWIAPLPGTGIVAGRVWSAAGEPVPQARVYGLVKPAPAETPFAFAETYGVRARGTPAYREHFAVGDVPPGEYVLWVEVEGRRISRTVRVEAGRLSWVELRP